MCLAWTSRLTRCLVGSGGIILHSASFDFVGAGVAARSALAMLSANAFSWAGETLPSSRSRWAMSRIAWLRSRRMTVSLGA